MKQDQSIQLSLSPNVFLVTGNSVGEAIPIMRGLKGMRDLESSTPKFGCLLFLIASNLL